MKLSSKDIDQLTQLAIRTAIKAGKYVEQHAHQNLRVIDKKETSGHNGVGQSRASQVLTEADINSQSIILDALQASIAQYDLALLSEEMKDDGSRFEKDYFWCIDPLDGTLAFTQSREGYSVVISLIDQAGKPIIGVIYDPKNALCYHANINENKAYRNNEALRLAPKDNSFHLLCDDSLLRHPRMESIKQKLRAQAQKMSCDSLLIESGGGAAYNAMKVLEYQSAIYFKPTQEKLGGGSIWDFAASVCIYNALQAYAKSYVGAELMLNAQGSTFMNTQGVYFASNDCLVWDL